MFSILCRRRLRVPWKYGIFVEQHFLAPQNAILVKSFSSLKSSPGVCENVSDKSFTISYLVNSCGLSSKDAISVSKKVCFKSHEKPDAVLELLKQYGFTNADIPRLVTRWPGVLVSRPKKNLLPKLEFFRSIGVPLPFLAQKLTIYPYVLRCSLKNSIIPWYNDLKSLLQSDKRVVLVFSRAPRGFGRFCKGGISSNTSILRERGVPESSIASLVMHLPAFLVIRKEKLAVYVDRAVEMGFDVSKSGFIHAIRVFIDLTESTLKRKMDLYRRLGWSEYDINAAFLRNPFCFKLSEKKITATMDFLVDKLKCKPVAIAECPVLLNYNLEKRIKPRCLVARILNDRGLKKMTSVTTLLILSEEKFLHSHLGLADGLFLLMLAVSFRIQKLAAEQNKRANRGPNRSARAMAERVDAYYFNLTVALMPPLGSQARAAEPGN
ncbi:hypothetical protein DH2020_001615 [Rehmannia glutinosa]|uniref:Uncharacterized protein n=1 Tax=Rehmannia glutinosa TaxID=99300 RepID=A0ABR0XZV2_REHGL